MSSKQTHGADHRAFLNRVNKIEGGSARYKKMITEEKYCVDILTQVKAARSALKSLELLVLEGHLNHCLVAAIHSRSNDEATEKVDEILKLLKKSSKS